jgi:cytochrome c-type biogenesis protein CcmH
MLLWISFALLAAAVATLLLRSPPTLIQTAAGDADLAVYRDQLGELEADASRGLIDTARTEIARRILKRAADPSTMAPNATGAQAERVLLIGAAALPVVSLALYLVVGSPTLPGRPLADRLAEPADRASPTDLIAKVEQRLRERPDDGQGWSVIAPIYLSQGRAVEAAEAFGRAIKLDGETPDRLAGLAKSNVLANNGIVNEPARAAYQRLAAVDPARVEARYWLGVYEEQNGRPEAAAEAYRAILAGGPADAPWRKPIEERLKAVTEQKSGPSVPGPAAANSSPPSGMAAPVLAPASGTGTGDKAGPTPAEFVAAAKTLQREMRELMIGRMVSKARDALKQNPKDVSAWSRVVTGHMALGKPADAEATLKDARAGLVGDPAALAEFDALAKSLGLSPS